MNAVGLPPDEPQGALREIMPSVLIPLAEGFEELEAVAVIDMLPRADIEVTVAGLKAGLLTGSRGTVLTSDTTLDAVMGRDFDMIVLPGGMPGVSRAPEGGRAACSPCLSASTGRRATRGRDLRGTLDPLAGAGCSRAGRGDQKPEVQGAGGGRRCVLPRRSGGRRRPADPLARVCAVPGTAVRFALQRVELLLGKAKREEVARGRPGAAAGCRSACAAAANCIFALRNGSLLHHG